MTKFLKTNYNRTIAYNKIDGKKIGLVFLSGLKSDMKKFNLKLYGGDMSSSEKIFLSLFKFS